MLASTVAPACCPTYGRSGQLRTVERTHHNAKPEAVEQANDDQRHQEQVESMGHLTWGLHASHWGHPWAAIVCVEIPIDGALDSHRINYQGDEVAIAPQCRKDSGDLIIEVSNVGRKSCSRPLARAAISSSNFAKGAALGVKFAP